jgi:predicted transposase YbfD/YdcC
VKENQPTLHKGIENFFVKDDKMSRLDNWVEVKEDAEESTHGRCVKRTYAFTEKVCRLPECEKWMGIKTAIQVHTECLSKGKITTENRYYISSLPIREKEKIAKAIRGHWGIENSLHWVLDLSFREDECRKRADHSPQNFSVLRRMVLNIIRKDPSKGSMLRKRKRAGWNTDFLEKLLSLGQATT